MTASFNFKLELNGIKIKLNILKLSLPGILFFKSYKKNLEVAKYVIFSLE